MGPVMNFYVFEAQWTRLRNKPAGRVALLRRIGARALPALFRESLDAELLASIIEALRAELLSEGGVDEGTAIGFAKEVLEALSKTSRFDLSISTFSAVERTACRELFDHLEKCASADTYDVLRLAYDPPPPPRLSTQRDDGELDSEELDPDDQADDPPPPRRDDEELDVEELDAGGQAPVPTPPP